jgi:hypothetical protein
MRHQDQPGGGVIWQATEGPTLARRDFHRQLANLPLRRLGPQLPPGNRQRPFRLDKQALSLQPTQQLAQRLLRQGLQDLSNNY